MQGCALRLIRPTAFHSNLRMRVRRRFDRKGARSASPVTKHATKTKLIFTLAFLTASFGNAYAGPPFVTDDPDPTDYQHFEVYLYSEGIEDHGANSGTPIGVEVNYGALPDVQISLALPAGFTSPSRSQPTLGITEAEFALKYRFIEEDGTGWRPQISFYPAVQVAIGSSGAGDNATHEFLPLWVQKSFGPWTTFGGAGYRLNPGPDARNSWFAGWGFLRRVSDHMQLGAELYHETPEARDETPNSGANVGAILDFNRRYHVVGSVGPRTSDFCHGIALSYYLALEWTP